MDHLLQPPPLVGDNTCNTDNRPSRLSALNPQDLRIGGFIPTTTVDYPDHLAAVIFTQGCPWRCRYCHNSHLAAWKQQEEFDWNDIFPLLKRRRNLLDGVVFSGGEPTAQPALASAITEVKALGYKIALHSGGPRPDHFKAILPDVDWVGFDIKGMPDQYPEITGADSSSGKKAWQSLQALLTSNTPYEIRTTVHWHLLTPDSIRKLARALKNLGVSRYIIQVANTNNMLDPSLAATPPPPELDQLWSELKATFSHFELR